MNNKHKLSDLCLKSFLEEKTLFYDKIDFTIIEKSWKEVEPFVNIPFIIHIVGTNGKGTTGRFLASYLNKIGKNTLHYTSPHISKFNERIWINGCDISDEELEKEHKELIKIVPKIYLQKLTYFEYTTLLALKISSNRDFLVLEAGLGGEFDATNVVKNSLSLITTIGLDHTDFLGDTIEKIAKTKMRSVDAKMIVGYQVEKDVFNYAKQIRDLKDVDLKVANMDYDLDKIDSMKLPNYLKMNLCLAIEALKELNFEIDLNLFKEVKLNGRCEEITNNITIDVGHNPLAAKELVKEFLKKDEKFVLIYNTFCDKDYTKILEIMKPIIKRVEIIKIDDKRVVRRENLNKVCKKLNIIQKEFLKIDETEKYLVFGSFLVVEKFLEYLRNR